MKEVFVIIPNNDVFYGEKVDKNTKLEFENEYVKQKIENLKLHSEYTMKDEKFTSTTTLDLKLEEGDILLLEEENRGYFLPKNQKVGTIEDYEKEVEFLKEQISKIKE